MEKPIRGREGGADALSILNMVIEGDLSNLKRATADRICLEGIRGLDNDYVLVGAKLNSKWWNPVMFALAFQKTNIFKFLMTSFPSSPSILLQDPPSDSEGIP